MKIKNKFSTKLLSYSSASFAFLALHHKADAQLVYTNVEPDFMGDLDGETYDLDLNNDGTFDFILSASSSILNYVTAYGANNVYIGKALFMDPLSSNSIAATAGASSFAYPFALAEGISVGTSIPFLDNSFQSLAYHFYALLGGTFFDPIIQVGNWFGGQTDKFIGLKLIDDGITFYGWARLDVLVDNKTFLLKDYAFNQTPNTPVLTDILSSIPEENFLEQFIHTYTYNHTLYINIKQKELLPAIAKIYSINGIETETFSLTDQINSIDLSQLSQGTYILQILQSNYSYSQKISIPK